MSKILTLHYILVKGIYRKPNKWVAEAVDALSFFCLFSLSLFIYLLILSQTEYWQYLHEYKKGIRSDWGIGVIGFVLVAGSMIWTKRFRVNHKMKRDILLLSANFQHIHSILYVLLYLILFAVSFYIMIFSNLK